MKKYLKIMRVDHWIKQLFIIPGIALAISLTNTNMSKQMILNIIIGFLSTSLAASANYVINEYCDRNYDKYHPLKKDRELVSKSINIYKIITLYFLLTTIGICLGFYINKLFGFLIIFLLFMGVVYNIKPFRTKDITYIDVLTESINNAIRLLLGWFVITKSYLPPCSVVIGYYFLGSYLMSIKRYSELRSIKKKEIAILYRKSFKYYSINSLLLASFFYALLSNLFFGIFLIKYKIELILIMPLVFGLFCYYFYLSFKEDSCTQRPEKLIYEKKLMIFIIIIIILFIVLMQVKIPFLNRFISNELIKIP